MKGAAGVDGECTKPCESFIQVAFMAGLSENFNHRNNSITFDKVITNVNTVHNNGAYDETTGYFTVPIAGIYAFHAHVLVISYYSPSADSPQLNANLRAKTKKKRDLKK